jgi:hypothetical protein
MSQKKKRGLHDSLSDIIKRQNAPIDEKTKMSANLLANFAPAERKTSAQKEGISHQSADPPSQTRPHKLPVVEKIPPIPRDVDPASLKESTTVNSERIALDLQDDADLDLVAERPFSEFSTRWTPFLRPAQMAVCKAIWGMTYAIGQRQCFSSMAKLAAAANLSERQCYRSVDQLEQRGLVERPEIFNTATTKGTIFILHTLPVLAHLKRKRIYHVGE